MKVNRKTVLSTAAVLGVAALIAGGTIAYFTDKDTATNTFTVGDVDVILNERDFDGNTLTSSQNLAPGNNEVAVPKVASVTVDQDSQDAWVWVDMLIPAELYNSGTETQESNNALHYNQFVDYLAGYENWKGTGLSTATNAVTIRETGLYQADHQWSEFVYVGESDGYAVLRSTHKDIVAAGETTSPALTQIYMDDDVHYETINNERKLLIPAHGEWSTKVNGISGDNYTATYPDGDGKWVEYDGDWEVIINAYGMQTTGFDTVDAAVEAYLARS